MARTALNYTKDQGSLQGVVIDHISPFRHIINYAGKYLDAYVWPGSNCDPKIGDKVTFKPFPNGGFNMIISGPNHDESNIMVCGQSDVWTGDFGSYPFINKYGFQWRKGSDDWHKVYAGDSASKIVKGLILKGSVDGIISDSYFVISANATDAETDQGFVLERSDDLGDSWTTLGSSYTTINDIAFDINKNLWAISGVYTDTGGPIPYTNTILKSNDNGDTLQVMWTESGADISDGSLRGLVRRIFPHPTDPLIVVVLYCNPKSFVIPAPVRAIVTIDGGLNWTEIDTGISSSGINFGNFSFAYHWIKDTGRLIMIGFPQANAPYLNHTGHAMWADGPNYNSWTLVDPTIDFRFDFRYDSTANPMAQAYRFSIFGDSDGSRIFCGGDWRGGGGYFAKGSPYLNLIFVSYDQGKSFKRFYEPLSNTEDFPNSQPFGSSSSGDGTYMAWGNGGTYDEINDAIYWHMIPNTYQGPNNHQITNQWQVIKMFPVIYGEDTVYDITQNLQPFVNEFTDPYGNPLWGDGAFNTAYQWTHWATRLVPY